MERTVHKLVTTRPMNDARGLDAELLKQVKHFGKQSEANMDALFHYIMAELSGTSARARFFAVELCDVLWARSARFRAQLAEVMPTFIEQTITCPRPPRPPAAGEKLRRRAARAVAGWANSHGARFRQVAHAAHYLRTACRLADLDAPPSGDDTPPQPARQASRAEETARILMLRFDSLRSELDADGAQLTRLLDSAAECFDILVPRLEAISGEAPATVEAHARPAAGKGDSGSSADEGEDVAAMGTEDSLRAIGITHVGRSLSVDLGGDEAASDDEEAAGNERVKDALRETFGEVARRYEPLVQRWLQTLSRVDVAGDDARLAVRRDLLSRAGGLCDRIQALKRQCALLGIDVGDEGAVNGAQEGTADGVDADDGDYEPGVEVVVNTALAPALPPAKVPEPSIAGHGDVGEGAPHLWLCRVPRRDGTPCAEAGDYCPFHGRIDPSVNPLALLQAPPIGGAEEYLAVGGNEPPCLAPHGRRTPAWKRPGDTVDRGHGQLLRKVKSARRSGLGL